MRNCPHCNLDKDPEEFFKKRKECKPCTYIRAKERHLANPDLRKNYNLLNQEKHRKYSRDYYHKNPEKVRAGSRKSQLKLDFGITPEHYEEMSIAQNHLCKICNKPETYKNRSLAVDHCHITGKVRGLLCMACNVGLGNFKDDENLLMKAIEYLK